MNTQYVLSLSYGKDSLACLEAVKQLGLPLDRIIHAEVWATPTIPADLPPMVEFKKKADKIIKERYGITVEHITATKPNGGGDNSFESQFYTTRENKVFGRTLYGFPCTLHSWCNSKLKVDALSETNLRRYILSASKNSFGGGNKDLRLPDASGTMVQFSPQDVSNRQITGFPTRWSQYCTGELKRSALTDSRYLSNGEIGVPNSKREFSESPNTTGGINIVQYLGIAADEPERIARHQQKENIRLPLVEIGWDETYCRQWCEENDLLSPIYTTATRGGCWFCHNQGVEQLRLLRKNYPDLWALLLKWDADSPTTFKPDGHTVHDFDKRFELEDKGVIDTKKRFYWKYIK